jgi:uncharacterized protein
MAYLRSLLFCTMIFFLGYQPAHAQNSLLPKMTSWINDYGKLLKPDQVEELTRMIRKYEKHTERGIVMVTVDSITPYPDMLMFANDVGTFWNLERRFKNNSLIIAVCGPCHKISIATGFGSGKKIPEAECKKIVDEVIIPEFKKEDYYLGLKNGIKAIIEKWGKE